ncbi:MAG: HIT domain-containing protein [Alphaproteobacteria bacterium]|nr:HIT domain-containing protein [Alphaproteobacteria bacterium]
MEASYDQNNIFAKILRQEVSSEKIYENEHVFAFKDSYPCAPTHVLVIPKNQYIDFSDFASRASNDEISSYYKSINEIIKQLNITSYRLVSNCGASAGQTIFHFHTHIISGKTLGNLTGE